MTSRVVSIVLTVFVLFILAIVVHDTTAGNAEVERIREQGECERSLITTGEFTVESVSAICDR